MPPLAPRLVPALVSAFGAGCRVALRLGLAIMIPAAVFYGFAAPRLDPWLPASAEGPASFVTEDGQLIGDRGAPFLPPLQAGRVPRRLEDVITAAEDHEFRKQPLGLRFRSLAWALPCGLLSAIHAELCRPRGASTLELQIARGCVGRTRMTPFSLLRKGKEILLAVWIARRWSKDEILARYANCVSYGRVQGLNAAAQFHFGKAAADLSVGEAALLVGSQPAPTRYDPLRWPRAARGRQAVVLARMVELGRLTPAQAARAGRVRSRRRAPAVSSSRAFLAAHAEALRDRCGEVPRACRITLDRRLARPAYESCLRRLKGRRHLDCAVVVMELDGRVRALVGGRDTAREWNNATRALRQPGSAVKPFTYGAAYRRGWRGDSVVRDTPVRIGDWSPNCGAPAPVERVTLDLAFAGSRNCASVWLAAAVGLEAVADEFERHGLPTPADPAARPAFLLGATEVTPIQLASAYAWLLSGCGPVLPSAVMVNRNAVCEADVGGRRQAALLESMRGAALHGTAARAGAGVRAWAKTGTSSGGKDGWVAGLVDTPRGRLVVVVWVGSSRGRVRDPVTGGGVPALIWNDVALAAARMPAATPRSPLRVAAATPRGRRKG